MEEFENGLFDPVKYLYEALLKRLSKKYRCIRIKPCKIVECPKRVLKAVRPAFIYNY
jgi:hypothetical protein